MIDKIWVEGEILSKSSTPRSYVVKFPDGTTLRRNSWWLRKTLHPESKLNETI